MKKEDIEIAVLTSKEILLSFFDFATPFFEASTIYRKSIREYKKERQCDKMQFKQRISYLKRKGYIRIFVEGKQKYMELTPRGLEKIKKISLTDLHIQKPPHWDSLWRLVIFDVPEKLRASRDMLRYKLFELHFIQVQKSVYVYPFPCTNEISLLSTRLCIDKYVTILIAEIIQGENAIINKFLEKKVLDQNDLIDKKV